MINKAKNILKYILWVSAFLFISFLIGKVTQVNMQWYETLNKSPLTPPHFVFPLVWTMLYLMLAVAGCSICTIRNKNNIKNIILFIGYMFINWSWSFVFFAGHFITVGFAWIILSDIMLGALIISLFKSGDRIELALLTPTLIWGIFAAYLNGYIAFG